MSHFTSITNGPAKFLWEVNKFGEVVVTRIENGKRMEFCCGHIEDVVRAMLVASMPNFSVQVKTRSKDRHDPICDFSSWAKLAATLNNKRSSVVRERVRTAMDYNFWWASRFLDYNAVSNHYSITDLGTKADAEMAAEEEAEKTARGSS